MLRLINNQTLKKSFVRWNSTSTTTASTPKKVITSIAPAGTKLKGLNVRKGGEDPIALPENEYPDWLWELLDPVLQKKKLAADPEKSAKKERRSANRKNIKMNNFLAGMKK